MGKNNNPRPLLVTLIAILNIILGLGAITGGSALVVGLIYILVGVGFLSGWSIMWYLGIIFEALAIILNVLSLFVGNFSAIIPILISLIIILYLLKPNVKRFFLE